MGKDNEKAVEALEDILSGGEPESVGEEEAEAGKETEDVSETSEEHPEGEDAPEKKTEAKEQPKTKTTLQTEEQVEINKEIAKIDAKIDTLKEHTVDEDGFYATIDDRLTEEEAALEFSDKTAYIKLVNKKLSEYMDEHSNSTEIKTLEDQKKDLEQVYKRQEGVVAVSQKYPDFDYEKVQEFFLNDLSKSEQQKIVDSSSSYEDVYELTFKKYQEANPASVKTVDAPKVPNVNKIRKEPMKPGAAEQGLKDENEELREALGI